jgi:hypothetical protein
MSFLFPKAPKPVPAPTTAVQAEAPEADPANAATVPGSMISTSSQGLTRKARTIKPSLIGSSTSGN